MAPTRRRTSAAVGLAATAGLCFLPSKHVQCNAFSSSTTRSSSSSVVAGGSISVAAGITSRSAIRPRHSGTRVFSTVEDVEERAVGDKWVSGIGHEVR